jgi:octaprenyl-diphosphate synthase
MGGRAVNADMQRTNNITQPLQELYGPVRDDLTIVERIFDDEIAGELPFVDDLCDTVRSYRGKMLRPALLLLSARATGELKPAHRTLAAVIEMVHMATLVHDDVLDEADERRRQPTVNNINGNVAAVLLGDYLISHAFHLCSGLRSQHASRRIGATTNIVCEGELLQNYRRGQRDLSESEYFNIIRRKTGTLTATACELGAYFAGADSTVVESLRSYGMSGGIAFQIIDDLLDIAGDQATVGKTLGRDASLGKLTLSVIHFFGNADRDTASAVCEAMREGAPGGRDRLRELLTHTGSIEYAVSVARDYVADAVQKLDPLPPSEAKTSLTAMAEFIIERRF